jgi:hypothetical protein
MEQLLVTPVYAGSLCVGISQTVVFYNRLNYWSDKFRTRHDSYLCVCVCECVYAQMGLF